MKQLQQYLTGTCSNNRSHVKQAIVIYYFYSLVRLEFRTTVSTYHYLIAPPPPLPISNSINCLTRLFWVSVVSSMAFSLLLLSGTSLQMRTSVRPLLNGELGLLDNIGSVCSINWFPLSDGHAETTQSLWILLSKNSFNSAVGCNWRINWKSKGKYKIDIVQ